MKKQPRIASPILDLAWPRWDRWIANKAGAKIASALFLALVLSLLAWGCFFQPPRNHPFEKPDALTWLRGRDVHHGYTKMPVVPVGLFHKFAPRGLATESAPCCGLIFDGTFHDARFKDTAGASHLVASIYQNSGTGLVYAVTPVGELYTLVAGDRWQKIPLTSDQSAEEVLAGSEKQIALGKPPYFRIAAIALSPDGSRLIAGRNDGSIVHRMLFGDKEYWTINLRQIPVTDVAWSHDGSRLAIGFADGVAQVLSSERDWGHVSGFWDALIAPPTRTLFGAASSINSIAFSGDDRLLVTGSQDKTVRLWSSASGANLAVVSFPSSIRQVAFSADGSRIGVLGDDGSFQEIDTVSHLEVTSTFSTSNMSIQRIAYSPQGRTLAGVDRTGKIYIWDIDSGRVLSQSGGGQDGSWRVAFSPDGELLSSGSAMSDLIVSPTRALGTHVPSFIGGDSIPITSLAFTPDDKALVLSAADGTVRLWALKSNNQIQIRAIAADADSALWAVGSAGYVSVSVDGKSFPNPPQRWLEDEVISMSPLGNDGMVLLNSQNQLAIAKRSSDGYLSFSPILGTLPKTSDKQKYNTIYVHGRQAWLASKEGVILYAPDVETPVWTTVFSNPNLSIDDLLVERSGVGWAVGLHDGRETVIAANAASQNGWHELSILLPRWVFVLGAPLLLIAIAAIYLTWRKPPEVLDSIDDLATCDLALRWHHPASLPLKPLVRRLSRFLRNVNTKPPLTIAVTGAWGSGKSSLMQLLMEDLQYHEGRTVWFNAWHHHEEDDLLAALFAAIRRDAPPHWWTGSGLIFRLRLLVLIRLARTLKTLIFAILFVALFVWCFNMTAPLSSTLIEGLGSVLKLQDKTVRFTVSIFSGGVAAGLFGLGLLWFKGQLSSLPANPAKLAAGIARRASLADFSDKLAFRSKFGEQFGEVCRALWSPSTPGLVIFIDDLDRCQPGDVLKILEAVNYLVSAGLCTVILGIDRKQVEFCVGYGFREIVGGVPDQELLSGATAMDVAYQKQRVFARRYLEKLINIEVEVPSLDDLSLGTLFPGSLVPDTKELGDGPAWLRRVKGGIRDLLQIAKASFFIILVASALAWGLNHTPSWLLTSLTSLDSKTAGIDQPSPAKAISSLDQKGLTAQEQKQQAPDDRKSQSKAGQLPDSVPQPVKVQPGNDFLPSAGWWTLWSPALAMCVLVAIVGVLYFLHLKPIVSDSDEFRFALRAVMPLFKSVNATPRVIKRYQNRMRYIAANLRRGLHEPDGLDVLVRWLGQRLGAAKNKYLPDVWFEQEGKLAIRESSLILLAAIEVFAPNAFANRTQLVALLESGESCSGMRPEHKKAWRDLREAYQTPTIIMPTIKLHTITMPTTEEVLLYPALKF